MRRTLNLSARKLRACTAHITREHRTEIGYMYAWLGFTAAAYDERQHDYL